jgi:prepilin-type N-terminal cleavage/methylation domain-containing protein
MPVAVIYLSGHCQIEQGDVMTRSTARNGFTLIELLVVIAIIAILVAMLLPAVQQVREAARKSQCQDHLHNIVIGINNYEASHMVFPAATYKSMRQDDTSTGTPAATHWGSMLLPFIEQKPLYDTMTWGDQVDWNAGANLAARQTQIGLLLCPSAPDSVSYAQVDRGGTNIGNNIAPCNYGVVMSGSLGNPQTSKSGENKHHMDDNFPNDSRHNGIFNHNTGFAMRDMTDGVSNTVGVGERYRSALSTGNNNRYRQYFCLGSPQAQDEYASFAGSIGTTINTTNETQYGYAGFSSAHPGGAQFSLMDGKVTFLSENIDGNVRLALGTRRGNDIVGKF